MFITKNSDYLCLLLLFLIGVSPPFTASSRNFFNIPPVQFSNQVSLGEPVLVWSDTIKNLNTLPYNTQPSCLSVYTSTDQYGCIETGPINISYNETTAYGFRLEKQSQVVAGVTYALGLNGKIVAGVRSFIKRNKDYDADHWIHPNFNNPDISWEGYSFGPYQSYYCDDKTGCTMNAMAFLNGETKLYLYVTLPSDILNTSRYEFHNLSLGWLRVNIGERRNSTIYPPTLISETLEFVFSGSIEVDKRCFVSADQSSLSFPTIKSNMNNGVVGQAKLSVISTCHNLGYRTSISVKLVPVGSPVEGNAMTLATSENSNRALGILFHPEHFPAQCEGGDSQPFYHYLLSGNHEPGNGPSTIQQDIYFSLCKYGIPTPGRHTAAVDMFVQWDN